MKPNLYPNWRVNLFVFALLVMLVGGYFYRQTLLASRELQNHSRDHAKILAAVVELNIRNAMLAKSGMEDIVAASLENSSRFLYYLDSIEPFSSDELTAFGLEAGFAGVKIVQAGSGQAVSGPAGWLPGRACAASTGLEHVEGENLYLFSFLPDKGTSADDTSACVLVGISAGKIDATIEKISVKRLLGMFDNFHDIAYVRIDPLDEVSHETMSAPAAAVPEDIMETILPMGDSRLVVALRTDRFSKRRLQLQNEFVTFITFLILLGGFSSWWLYRIQHQRLSEVRRFERELARQHEDAALGRAASTITHELRNPLNAIGMGLQRLQLETTCLEKEQQDLLVSMQTAVGRADSIVSSLRQYAHSFDIARHPVAVPDLFRQLLTLYRPQCEKQGIAISCDCEESCSAAGDENLLAQLFENLLKNGVEAQPDGGFLRVDVKNEDMRVRVEIENGGCSLSGEECEMLFEPYFTTKSKGTGLGLVISRKIVQAHGGELEWQVDFAAGRIVFRIVLPGSSPV